MADAFLSLVQKGKALSSAEIVELAALVAEFKRKSGEPRRLAELAVAWVIANPTPMKLETPAYGL
jgi:hypothetical protein